MSVEECARFLLCILGGRFVVFDPSATQAAAWVKRDDIERVVGAGVDHQLDLLGVRPGVGL
jgi:hypothetical protein